MSVIYRWLGRNKDIYYQKYIETCSITFKRSTNFSTLYIPIPTNQEQQQDKDSTNLCICELTVAMEEEEASAPVGTASSDVLLFGTLSI